MRRYPRPAIEPLEERIALTSQPDIPVPGDYEGIGKTAQAFFRPSTDQWFIHLSNGTTVTRQFGDPAWNDQPVPGDYEGIGKTDLAVFRPSTDQWIIRLSNGNNQVSQFGDPRWGDVPSPDYYGDGHTAAAVYRPTTGQYFIQFGGTTASVTPAPYNAWATPSQWASLHAEFVSQAKRPNVLFLGDSVTYLWSDAGKTPQTADVRAKFIPPRGTSPWNTIIAPYGAANFGIPGDQTQNLLWRVLKGEVTTTPMTIVVLIGNNDLNHGKTPIATADGIIAVAKTISTISPAARILLLGILPPMTTPGDPLLAKIAVTNAIVAGWASRHNVSFDDLGRLLNGMVDVNGHPTPQGYETIATAIQRQL